MAEDAAPGKVSSFEISALVVGDENDDIDGLFREETSFPRPTVASRYSQASHFTTILLGCCTLILGMILGVLLSQSSVSGQPSGAMVLSTPSNTSWPAGENHLTYCQDGMYSKRTLELVHEMKFASLFRDTKGQKVCEFVTTWCWWSRFRSTDMASNTNMLVFFLVMLYRNLKLLRY